MSAESRHPNVLVGEAIAKEFGLKIGDKLPLVVPRPESGTLALKPKLKVMKIAGITSMGRYDYDSRYILADINMVKKFSAIGERGWRLKLNSADKAINLSREINTNMPSYSARNWWDVNANLFEAIKYEKPVIFLVIFVIILAAAFNVTSSLFINVMTETKDIATLKAIGMSESALMRLYVAKGLIIGFLGSLGGILLGLIFCWILNEANNKFGLLPSKVYTITDLQLELRFLDLLVVVLSSLFICFLAVLLPAYQASKKPITEGLRYE